MTEHVPNEVLETILQHAVSIPSDTFEAWSTPSTFAGTPPSTISDILLVSRRWHDLAMPFLYESAILRRGSQVARLARSANISNERGVKRGTYLRRLRVEGGYGGRLKQLLGVAPNIDTLFIGFDISLNDSSAGLRRALQRINPSSLFLQATFGPHSTASNTMSLYAAVAGALTTWTNVKRIITSPKFVFGNSVVPPLSDVPTLEFVSMTTHTAGMNLERSVLESILWNRSVKTIQIRDGVNWLARNSRFTLPACARGRFMLGEGNNAVRWSDFPPEDVTLAAPASTLPDLPDKIWAHILGYATYFDGFYEPSTGGLGFFMSTYPKLNVTRKNIILVHRRFWRLGLPYLYSIPYLSTWSAVLGFAARIQASPELAAHVRVLDIGKNVVLPHPIVILTPLVNLVCVSDPRIVVLPALDRSIPAGERSPLEYAVQALPASASISSRNFLNFTSLRELTLHGSIGGELDNEHTSALPRLERLGLIDPGAGMFEVFCPMSLPALRHLAFSIDRARDAEGFLRTHGSKLETLSLHGRLGEDDTSLPVLDSCPNVSELHLLSEELPDRIPFVSTSAPHAALQKVVCPSFTINVPGYHDAELRRWIAFIAFLASHKSKLPALEEFRIHKLDWPEHSFAYSVSKYSVLASDLHELGVALSDKDGTRWARFYPTPWSRL
ncbi:hypothetical protein C8Q77DRAFT_1088430 [Trametes polyzona]|nr:hypothetical protein C8Q77DRAFT_1088430 [Trametes polyzona]